MDSLSSEIAAIQTPEFHLVHHEFSLDGTDVPSELVSRLPPSYLQFINEFGGVRLYRKRQGYLLNVFQKPTLAKVHDANLIEIGHCDSFGSAYFRIADLFDGYEAPVLEIDGEGEFEDEVLETNTVESFSTWLDRCRKWAYSQYSKSDWESIFLGPIPFSDIEKQIILARKQFKWKTINMLEDNRFIFEVVNDSQITLPYLSVGVRTRSEKLFGRIWLPVSTIGSHEKAFIEQEIYRGLVEPDDIELYELPDPLPNQRDIYWEFKSISPSRRQTI